MNSIDSRRSGVALIIVLGMLSLLMIMAVAFSITMRVERASAGNVSYATFTRHFMSCALTRALEDIDAKMMSNGVPVMYPTWDCITSSGGGYRNRIVWGEALDYLPAALRTIALNTNSAFIEAFSTYNNGIAGRYSYTIFNCSGYLDCHYAGGSLRGPGTNIGEVRLSSLSDVANAIDLVSNRGVPKFERFESLNELYTVRTNVWNTRPANFMTTSYFPPGRLAGTNTSNDTVYIGGDIAYLQSHESEVEGALVQSGIANLAQAKFVFTNLLDYLDSDCIPHNLGDAYTESVPMFNEIISTSRISCAQISGTNRATVQTQLKVEWWYPFVRPSGYDFYMQAQIMGTVSNTASTNWADFSASAVKPSNYIKDTDIRNFKTVSFNSTPASVALSANPGDNLRITMKVRLQMTLDNQPPSVLNMVDAVPFPTSTWFDVVANAAVPAVGSSSNVLPTCWETIDPRFNWIAPTPPIPSGFITMWRQPTNGMSLGATNEWTLAEIAKYKGIYGIHQDGDMYVSDAGKLSSPGELGNLLRATMIPPISHWELYFNNIRLFDATNNPISPGMRHDTILDRFSTHTNATKGFVNLNTTNREVLASLFSGAPLYYPSNANVMSTLAATNLADSIIAYRLANPGFQFTNRSDLGRLDWRSIMPGRSDLERSSAIAYTASMTSPRQNLFVIVLAAGASSQGMGEFGSQTFIDQWLGFQRAVAVVWRDPFPDGNGNYRTVLKYFRYLPE